MSGRIESLRREAFAELRAGALDGAEKLLSELEREDPSSLETRALRVELCVRSRQPERAGPLVAELLAEHPGSADVCVLAGRVAYAKRAFEDARVHFEAGAALDPRGWSRALLGRALLQLGRLDEAESVIRETAAERGVARRDLAWLHDLRGEPLRALEAIESYLRDFPRDGIAVKQRLRLRARLARSDDLVREIDARRARGEHVPPEIAPEYCDTLLRTGRRDGARDFLRDQATDLDAALKTRIAWIAYKRRAWEVALDLFTEVAPDHLGNPKFRTALEAAAKRAGCAERVIDLYRAHESAHPRLGARRAKLRRWLEAARETE